MQSVENVKKSLTDIEIAQSIKIKHIKDVASTIGIGEDDLDYYGKYKAKLPLGLIDESKIKAALEENRKNNVNKKKSKFQTRLEDAMKASQETQRQKKKK